MEKFDMLSYIQSIQLNGTQDQQHMGSRPK
jgi:hypothetical protein